MGIVLIVGAIPGFFIAAWFIMLMWGGLIASKFGMPTMSYPTALLVTITLWMGIAPLLAASFRNILSSKS
jgi:hypothetical protein